jgi:hypothetical protein
MYQEQVRLNARSMKSRIADAIVERLNQVSDLVYVKFDEVKVNMSDFLEHELPACQVIDVNETVEHEQNRAKKTWNISLEVVLKQTTYRTVNQQALWDLIYQIERKLWTFPNLLIPGVVQMVYLGNQTDLHLVDPYYVGRLDFQVVYYESLVRDC